MKPESNFRRIVGSFCWTWPHFVTWRNGSKLKKSVVWEEWTVLKDKYVLFIGLVVNAEEQQLLMAVIIICFVPIVRLQWPVYNER